MNTDDLQFFCPFCGRYHTMHDTEQKGDCPQPRTGEGEIPNGTVFIERYDDKMLLTRVTGYSDGVYSIQSLYCDIETDDAQLTVGESVYPALSRMEESSALVWNDRLMRFARHIVQTYGIESAMVG